MEEREREIASSRAARRPSPAPQRNWRQAPCLPGSHGQPIVPRDAPLQPDRKGRERAERKPTAAASP